ncbi:pre-60s factor [Diaporthe amygdali]|uniref:pre-60s factor n=1 Tax=Phomopsis amygdali TaxID=1214568 RepID=UPI0022FF3487|nr:pre-60s factor [Diaporthe amygdali]KAJ0117499.1 pre-60s factor [Diaporthe amygdali]
MTASTDLMGASVVEAPSTGKGKATASQKSLPNSPEVPTEEDKDDVEASDIDETTLQESKSEPEGPTFTSTKCLFCNTASPDFESNLSHMSKKHSFFIPSAIDNNSLTLAVDLETLVQYMHLVISTYHECLFCHTQRQSAHAVQQHMMGKGHCRVDLEDDESEFRDFYEDLGDGSDGSSTEDGLGSEDEVEAAPASSRGTSGAPLRLRDKSLLLSSGKLLSHRSAQLPKYHRPLSETPKPTRRGADQALLGSDPLSNFTQSAAPNEDGIDPSVSPAEPSADTSRALTRLERRAETNSRSTLSVALAKMSLNDRTALAHLPPAEQRAFVVRQFKQQDKARQQSRSYWSRMERKNNSVLMKHFVSDVPGPKLG